MVYAGDEGVYAETDDGMCERYGDIPPVVCGFVGGADVGECGVEGVVCDERWVCVDDLSDKVCLFGDFACDVYCDSTPCVCGRCEDCFVVGVLSADVVVDVVCWRACEVLDMEVGFVEPEYVLAETDGEDDLRCAGVVLRLSEGCGDIEDGIVSEGAGCCDDIVRGAVDVDSACDGKRERAFYVGWHVDG